MPSEPGQRDAGPRIGLPSATASGRQESAAGGPIPVLYGMAILAIMAARTSADPRGGGDFRWLPW